MNAWETELENVLKQVSSLIQDAEDLVRNNGIDVPKEQPQLSQDKKVQFPRGYIRKTRYFEDKYALKALVGEEVSRNIAYALQLSDVFNYFFNRFNIGLSAGSLLYKYGLINVISVIESILYGCYIQQREWCIDAEGGVCRNNQQCTFYLKSINKLNFRSLINILRSKKLLILSTEQEKHLFHLKHLRDNIHSWKVEDNEFLSGMYTLESYNRAICLLEEVSIQLSKSVVEFGESRRSEYRCYF